MLYHERDWPPSNAEEQCIGGCAIWDTLAKSAACPVVARGMRCMGGSQSSSLRVQAAPEWHGKFCSSLRSLCERACTLQDGRKDDYWPAPCRCLQA